MKQKLNQTLMLWKSFIQKQTAYFKMQMLSVHTQHTLSLSLLSQPLFVTETARFKLPGSN